MILNFEGVNKGEVCDCVSVSFSHLCQVDFIFLIWCMRRATGSG